MEVEIKSENNAPKITRIKSERKSGGVPSSLNVKKLISVIKSRPLIYQTDHDNYRNPEGRNNIWEEIAMEMEWSEKICKAKWRACRDQYARELKRFGNNMNQSRWKYTKDLEFLRPYTLKRVYKQRSSCDQTKDSYKSDDDSIREEIPRDSSFGRSSEISGEMQFEKDLINEIKEHEYLYNTHHPNYRKFENKKLIWESIGSKINKTENQCRLKWKALRDQFSREAKRVSCCEDPESTPKWKHYEDLKFLEKHVKLSDTKKKTKSIQKAKTKDHPVIIRKTIRRKDIKEEIVQVDEPVLDCVYDEVDSLVPEEEYTFEIVKAKEESLENVNEEIYEEDGIEYDAEFYEEDIISKEHSYPTNEIIEFISFAEEVDNEEVPEDSYPEHSGDQEIIANVDENDEEITVNQEEQIFCEEVGGEESLTNKSTTEDMEVDSFFKTLAMKVKNAKLSQSHFTDLQIELLQTIQNKLKNS